MFIFEFKYFFTKRFTSFSWKYFKNKIFFIAFFNNLLNNYKDLPRFLLFQNTIDELKNINYKQFKNKINNHEVLLSEKVTIKYNNQRNSFYPPVHESVYFEVLKF